MKTTKNASATLATAAQALQSQMEKDSSGATVIIAGKKMHTIDEFVQLFVKNFDEILNRYDLNKSEIRVIFRILRYMQFGNLINLNNTTLARDLNIDKSNISRIMKRLKGIGLLVELNGALFFNPHVACKGTLNEKEEEKRTLLEFAAMILDEQGQVATPAILTKNLRKKLKKTVNPTDEVNERLDEYFAQK